MTLFTGHDLWDGARLHRDVALRISATGAEIVAAAGTPGTDLSRDGQRALVTPGLIDLQVNGGAGRLLGDLRSGDELRAMSAAHWATGTAAILPTLISDSPATTRHVIDLVAATQATEPGILGLHLEGPHLAVAGAHDPAMLRPITDADLALYTEARDKLGILMVTLAPEMATPDQITALAEAGVIVALGHSACDHDTACAAFEAGARMATHLFNAMSGLHHRDPGLVGATLARAKPYGLIADGVHVHPAAVAVALSANPHGAVLVSDAMALTGSAEDHFTLGGRMVLRRNGRLELSDGTLAGADLALAQAVTNIATWQGRDITDVVAMATTRPLAVIGRSQHPVPTRWVIWHAGQATGRIEEGAVLPLGRA